MVNIAASPFRLGKSEVKHNIFSTITQKYDLPIIYVNQVGGQDSLVFDGGCLAVNRYGQVINASGRFQEDLLIIEVCALIFIRLEND